MDVFRFFRPSGEPREDKAGKRRAQVRRAQQTYRLRKDQYTKSLEEEVARLRVTEASLLQETQHLRETVETLHGLRGARGGCACTYLHAPTLSPSEESQPNPDTPSLSEAYHQTAEQAKIGRFPVSPAQHTDSFWPEFWHDGSFADEPNRLQPALDDNVLPTRAQVPVARDRPDREQARSDDDHEMNLGMEFVLALEAPCLNHIHGDISNPSQPGGHALTVSSHLLAISPPASYPTPPSPQALHEVCEKTPASILGRLLTLSDSLALSEGEVTPVKAWNRIRCLPQFDQLKGDGIHALIGRLQGAVKCHGFGAVFQQTVFEKLLREIFVKGVRA